MTDRPLLKLAMIVKNEARTLAQTLRSVRDHIDAYAIFDTGSTDGTQDLIRAELADVPGEVHEGEFVDFATARNKMLEFAGDDCEYVLWLDADDELVVEGNALRAFLDSQPRESPPHVYYVQVEVPGTVFDSTRVLKRGHDCRFVGVVHEALVSAKNERSGPRIPGVLIRHHIGVEGGARTRERWERDVVLLEAQLKEDLHSTRTAFYLGMTLRWLERHGEAVERLAWRVRLGGWPEEVYYAQLSMARSMSDSKRPWPEVLAAYLEAHRMRPTRAEALYELAMHYDGVGDHANAYLFALRAAELPVPDDVLFVERHIHDYAAADLVGTHAWYLGELAVGERFARKAAEARPDDARLQSNLGFYAGQSMQEAS